MIGASEAIVIARAEDDLARGVYPPAVEEAGTALQTFKGMVLW